MKYELINKETGLPFSEHKTRFRIRYTDIRGAIWPIDISSRNTRAMIFEDGSVGYEDLSAIFDDQIVFRMVSDDWTIKFLPSDTGLTAVMSGLQLMNPPAQSGATVMGIPAEEYSRVMSKPDLGWPGHIIIRWHVPGFVERDPIPQASCDQTTAALMQLERIQGILKHHPDGKLWMDRREPSCNTLMLSNASGFYVLGYLDSYDIPDLPTWELPEVKDERPC